jgi:ABC-type glutathione transport system ATPase component
MNYTESIRIWLEDKKSKQQLLLQQIEDKEKQLVRKKLSVEDLIMARWIITEVAIATQKKFKDYIENLVSKAIRAVFEERSMRFILEFDVLRNKSEAVMKIQEGSNEPYIPKEEMGGSVVDLIGMALRPTLGSLERPSSRKILILDEPMKNLGHGKHLKRAGDIFKAISHKLGYQLIILTHEPEIIQIADRSWRVTHNGVHSEVTMIKSELVPGEEPSSTRRRLL